MGYQTDTDDGRELVLDNKKLTLIFVGLLVVCGCFFVAGRLSVRYDGGMGLARGTDLDDHSPVDTGNRASITGSPDLENYNRMNVIVSKPEGSTPPPMVTESLLSPVEPTPSAQPVQIAATTPSPVSEPITSPVVPAESKPTPKESVERIAREVAQKVLPPAKPAVSEKNALSVQVAAFHARREAELKAREIKAKGFDPRIEVPSSSDGWYRIKIGRFDTRAEANAMLSQIKASGFDAMIKPYREEN